MCKLSLHSLILFHSPDNGAGIQFRVFYAVFFGYILDLAIVEVNEPAAVYTDIAVVGENAAFIKSNITPETLIVDIV